MSLDTCLFRSTACQSILCDIRHYQDDAESIFRRKERFDQDSRDFYARTMVLFALTNRLMDLAREVTLIRGYISSEEQVKNKVLFKRLHDHGVISWEMRQQMIDLVNFRNQVSHHFYEVTRYDIENVWQMIPICSEFVRIMEQEIVRRNQEKKNMVILAGIALVLLILVVLWF